MALLVDFHTHFFSRAFFETLAAGSPLPGSLEDRMDRVMLEEGLQLPLESTADHWSQWRAEMKRYGIGHLVSFASVPEERETLAEARRISDGLLSTMLVVDPTRAEASERLAAALTEDGFSGALFFPAMHRYRLDGRDMEKVVGVLAEHGGVALVHCGLLRIPLRERFELPGAYDPALANPLHLAPLASAHPEVPFVVPHFGGGFLRETLLAGAQCPNLHVDTSSSNGWIRTQPWHLTLPDVFERTLDVFGPERVLFGTDSSVFPRGWRHDVLLTQREALGACGITDAERQLVLGGNAARLLGLPA